MERNPSDIFNEHTTRYACTNTGSNYGKIGYRIVIVPRYRRNIFRIDGATASFEIAAGNCATENGFSIKKLQFGNDYAQLEIEAEPHISPRDIVNQIKLYATRRLKKNIPELSNVKSIWTKQSFIATCPSDVLSLLNWEELGHEYARRQPTHG